MKRRTFWTALGLCFLCGGALTVYQADLLRKLSGNTRNENATDSPAETAPLTRIGALGRIEPSSEVLDIDAAVGDRVLRLLVKEGQRVSEGEELVLLESHDVTLAEKEEIAVQLEEARHRAATTKEQGQAMIRTAEVRLRTVKQLEPIRIDSQKAKVRSIEAECKNAENEFQRAVQLLGKRVTTNEDHDRRKLEYMKLQELLTSSRLTLAEMEANQELALESAQAALDEARATMEQSLAAIPVQSFEKKLALGEERLKRTVIRSPIAGQVLKIHTHAGERVGNRPLLRLGNTDEMHAVAEVYETDITRVRLGQRATVSCSSLASPIQGTVVQIGLMIYKNDVLKVDPAADADARVVEVRIKLDEPQRVAGLTNLQVDVLIDEKAGTR